MAKCSALQVYAKVMPLQKQVVGLGTTLQHLISDEFIMKHMGQDDTCWVNCIILLLNVVHQPGKSLREAVAARVAHCLSENKISVFDAVLARTSSPPSALIPKPQMVEFLSDVDVRRKWTLAWWNSLLSVLKELHVAYGQAASDKTCIDAPDNVGQEWKTYDALFQKRMKEAESVGKVFEWSHDDVANLQGQLQKGFVMGPHVIDPKKNADIWDWIATAAIASQKKESKT